MGVDIRDAAGNIDTAKAQQVADLALDFQVAKGKKNMQARGDSSVKINFNAMTMFDPLSRRAAREAVNVLSSSSFLVKGEIDSRMALKALKMHFVEV